MKQRYNFSNGIVGKYTGKIAKKSSWVLEPDQCRFCGKLSYESVDDANYAIKQKPDQKLNSYSCPYETAWHLTSISR